MTVRVKGWSGRSRPAKVDLYTRGTVYGLVWAAAVGLALLLLTEPVREGGAPALVVAGPPLALAMGAVCARLARRSMDAYLGRGAVPRRVIGCAAATTAAVVGTVLALATAVPSTGLLVMMLATALLPFVISQCLITKGSTLALTQGGVLAVIAGLLPLRGATSADVAHFAAVAGFTIAWTAFTIRVSMWVLAVMWELREARDVQARLAVAEERLRFGRDLHDVLGRNLAVIALKSELAVQLARRGRPEAVEQMAEVQRTAQESQREVRDVVRGYRAADLPTELAGARGVLTAAGINCSIGSPDSDLPAEVQSALAWVVREATTNVLRHGDAARCSIRLAVSTGSAVLTVENDGVRNSTAPDVARGQGSGLTGLRERLAVLGGTLEAKRTAGERFRLTAEVPLPRAVAECPSPNAGGTGGAAEQTGGAPEQTGGAPEQEDDREPGSRAAAARR
ncbi:sensor histidine kinase [Streptomyces sp. NPDC091376]|uniref:sensor histidine kinase n=1 Tax=Streptomyces sp. NPDC091376 TaxID=3365994 RepID=UPI00381D7186